MSEDEAAEKEWAELPPELRKAIIAAGKRRLFWRQVREMFAGTRDIAGIFLTIAAAYVLLRNGFLDWISGQAGQDK